MTVIVLKMINSNNSNNISNDNNNNNQGSINDNKYLLSHGTECNMGNIFWFSHILWFISRAFRQVNSKKNEKRGKYLLILHKATCDNYFIVKCLLKSNTGRAILLIN